MVRVIKARRDNAETKQARLRVAAYCRVSTDSGDQETSFEAQQVHYSALITSNPAWILAGIYADEGISGTQVKTRSEFQRLMDDCKAGRIDLILTKSISRFSRNTLDCLEYVRKLKDLRIPVIFEKEHVNTMEASGELLLTILASLAQGESESISHNVRLGIQYGFQQGKPKLNSKYFLGYDSPLPHVLAINPEQAVIVRRIYRLFLEGLSPDKIARKLTAENVPTVMGKSRWFSSVIQGILTNEKYCGDLLMQKYFVTDFISHRLVRNEGQLPQYFVEDNHEPIVPKDIWIMVQGELKRRAKLSLRNNGRLRLVCQACGDRYRLENGVWRGGNIGSCGCRRVKKETVETAIREALDRLRTDEVINEQNRLHKAIEEIDSKFGVNMVSIQPLTVPEIENEEEPLCEAQNESLSTQQEQLSAKRAELSMREVSCRLLTEHLVLHRNSDNRKNPSGAAMSIDDGASCTNADDFFRRTSHPMESIELIEKVMVGKGLTVVFKAGVLYHFCKEDY